MSDEKRIREQESTLLLIGSHCLTLRRKPNKIGTRELSAILDDLFRELCDGYLHPEEYMRAINEVVAALKGIRPSTLSKVASHDFFIFIQNAIHDLLLDWYLGHKLCREETFALRNCVLLLYTLVNSVDNVMKLIPCLVDAMLIDIIAHCMDDLERLLKVDKRKRKLKQLTRLLRLFSTYIQRLPPEFSDKKFDRLLKATMDSLASPLYEKVFRTLKNNTDSLTVEQKFFLIKCPTFLTCYRGSQSVQAKEHVLGVMVPRYASLLDKHMLTVHEWRRPMVCVVHQLLLTVTYAKGHYTSYAAGQPLRWLIDHIVRILGEPMILAKVIDDQNCPETMLTDSALNTLSTLVREPDLFVYIKQLKATSIFRSLILSPYETIASSAYLMLGYVMDEEEIKASEKASGRLLSNLFESLRRAVGSLADRKQDVTNAQSNIAHLFEAVQGLMQHDQIKNEVFKQNALQFLINNIDDLEGTPKEILVETLSSLTFNDEAARQLRENSEFLKKIKYLQRTGSDAIQKATERIIWKLTTEPKRREKFAEKEEEKSMITFESDGTKHLTSEKRKYKYDMIISYCHADKELVYRLQQFLADQGFIIWFNRDDMHGPTTTTMAEAVENSEFVIICMSDSYKRSTYCQVEAEYAFNCKRRLLPLRVREGYKPDGWLGFMVGTRTYIDYGQFEFSKACELLMNEINLQRQEKSLDKTTAKPTKEEAKSKESASVPVPAVELAHLPDRYTNRDTKDSIYGSVALHTWSNKDVLDFLFDAHLHHMMPLCELLTGQGLNQFFDMCKGNQNQLYNQLNNELHARFNGLILPMGTFTQFLSEMNRLTTLETDPSPSLPETIDQEQ